MLFNSLHFLIFFPIVTIIYFAIPDKIKYLWLLASSYYFYMCWNAKYALLLLFSTAVTYLSGLLMQAVKEQNWTEKKQLLYKKIIVGLCFGVNLAILFYFKYVNFTFDLLAKLFMHINIQLTVPNVDVLLPVGISFFTFQALSYTMDVYRDEIYAEKNFFRYALFVSFFPQLVAGPIERSKNLLKQLAVPQKFNFEKAKEGLLLMLWGFFLKIVLADRIAVFVDKVYAEYASYPGWYLIVATMLFAVQIYCDFSGYSTIAVGTGKIIGVELMENFDAPYLSTSVSEFWRKWHISLTSWFKDYLYIPLGGGRKGQLRKYANKMIVFLVSGLWHGANMTFVIWGGLNGLYQLIGEASAGFRNKIRSKLGINQERSFYKIVQMAITFVLIDFSWLFFRASGLSDAVQIIKQMLKIDNYSVLWDGSLYECGLNEHNFILMLLCILLLLFVDSCKHKGIKCREIIMKQNFAVRCLVLVGSICAILVFGLWGPAYNAANFIYFQF